MKSPLGLYTCAQTGETKLLLLKSVLIAQYIADGMSEDEAEEFYSFNIEGSKGIGSYSVIDDTLTPDDIEELIAQDLSLPFRSVGRTESPFEGEQNDNSSNN